MRFSILFILLFLSSCAKMGYVLEQGIGQLALEYNGEDNEDVLKDPKVKKEHKEKIKKIITYKKFFYKYFDKKPTPIYEETTFLEHKAVTYLVIASSKKNIKPFMTSFPFVGEFPYLGFFDLDDANEFKSKMEDKGYSTYLRPVFAYTTLNKLPFYDNIISSFFEYKEDLLAETIFHELIHTVFFIEDEIDFNESLADYFAKMLSYEYFKYSNDKKIRARKQLLAKTQLMQKLADLTSQLNNLYKKTPNLNDKKAVQIKDNFIKEKFKPQIKKLCEMTAIENCWPIKQKWNNAKLAAFMTYSKEQNLIEKIQNKKKYNLKQLLSYLEKKYQRYQSSNKESFAQYLKQKEKL